MYIAKQKQTHRYRKLTSGHQWGEGKWEGQDRGREILWDYMKSCV